METPPNTDPSPELPAWKAKLKTAWTTLKQWSKDVKEFFVLVWEYLNITNFLRRLIALIRSIVLSLKSYILIAIFLPIGLSIYGIVNNYVFLICAMGLFWLLLLLGFIGIIYDSIQRIGDTKPNFEEIKFSDDRRIALLQFLGFVWEIFLHTVKSALNTTFAILIILAYLITEMHASAATGDFQMIWQQETWTLLDFIIIVVLPLASVITDSVQIKKGVRKPSGITLLFGVLQFFLSFVFLTTGLFGGEPAVLAIDYIIYNPIEWFFGEFLSAPTINSHAYQIYDGIGFWLFLFIYGLMPITLVASASGVIESDYSDKPKKLMSVGTAKWMILLSVPFLLIFLYVFWHKGWITLFLQGVLAIIIYIVQLLGQLINWIAGLFG